MYIGDPGYCQPSALPAHLRRSIRFFEVSDATSSADVTPFSALLVQTDDAPLPGVPGSYPAAILYTSGTTARPKGVTHSHDSLRQCAIATNALGFSEDDVSLNFVPLAHASGLMVMLIPAIMLGAETALVRAFEPTEVLRTLARRRCTATFGLPAMLQALCREQSENPVDVSSLRMCGAGGDSVSVSLQREFNEIFGVVIQEGIGMTELVPTCCNRPDRVRQGSVGEPADGIAVRILHESGDEVAPGEIGEMVVRGAAIMLGYWNNQEATSSTIRDGWLYTGDLARKDEHGYIWFAGRKKEVIIRGGSNVSPQEVEEILLKHPAVFQSGVVGMPDPELGESVVAFVSLRDGAACGESELIEFSREYLSEHKVPGVVHFIDVLPLGPTGKVSRRTLKETLQAAGVQQGSPL
jgi:long-chain acyl-CoA synthetase